MQCAPLAVRHIAEKLTPSGDADGVRAQPATLAAEQPVHGGVLEREARDARVQHHEIAVLGRRRVALPGAKGDDSDTA